MDDFWYPIKTMRLQYEQKFHLILPQGFYIFFSIVRRSDQQVYSLTVITQLSNYM